MWRYIRIKVIPFLIFLFSGLYAAAGEYPPLIRLSIANGLSNNSVRCVYQDRKGFIWFGTHYGLNRYDGNEFKIFTNKLTDSASLPHNYINTIHEDKFNRLWVATGQALTMYNSVTNSFSTELYYPYQGDRPQRMQFGVQTINSDDEGNVFLGTDELGLLVIKAGEKYARPVPLTENGQRVTGYSVRSVCIYNSKVWLLLRDRGLGLYDVKTNRIEIVNGEVKRGNIFQADNKGSFWIGAEDGLFKYSLSARKVTESYGETPGKLSAALINSLCLDKQGRVWIGTERAGVSIFDPQSKTFSYISSGEGKYNLSSECVNSIISDRESRIWIGTLRGGCNVVDEEKNRFQTISRIPFTENSLPGNFIYSFCEDRDGDLLIGTDGEGLSVWNRKTNTFRNYKHINGVASSLSHNSVANIKLDSYGNTWIATFGGGINRFNKASGTFEHYACINDSAKTENKVVWWLLEDRMKNLWASTYGGKLYKFNREANRFQVFSQEYNTLMAMFEDSRGNLWAGTSTQLLQVDKTLLHGGKYFEIGKPVRSIYEDKRHNLWLGTEGGGLIRFDIDKWAVAGRYSEMNGLCNNAVLNILEDSTGCLWLSTLNGLSRFDPKKEEFSNFYQSDGLQSNQFSYRAALALKSGQMVFGGINGFNLFYPHRISVRNYMPPVYLTDILINNKPVFQFAKDVLSTEDGSVTALRIPYDQSFLSFKFSALEYTSPDKISYAYYLQGWDKDWNYSGNFRNISYNNVREGTYTLRIKNTNSKGEWNTKELVLKITILPPWYRTWWAYLLYFTLGVSLLYAYYRYKTQQTKLKYKVKLTELNAEKEKEINEKRQSFFTNITHEFRTPLTLIINPVKDLLHKENEQPEKEELNLVYRNARRLMSLVDQLLLFRKTESETGELHISKLNFYQLCHDTYLYFAQQAKSKGIEYTFDCENHDIEVYADKEKLGTVFYNLFSNALKYTPKGGKVTVKITETADTILGEVTDSGQGIPPGSGDKIFDKFYQVNEKDVPLKPGFGIGLYLVKKMVEEHNGKVYYESKPGEGTSFFVVLKKGRQHFDTVENENADSTPGDLLDEIGAGNELVAETAGTLTDGLESIVSEKQSILITDDNQQMRGYLAQVFLKEFIVYEAGDGLEGLKMAKTLMPDIIISDVVMEPVSGIEFCKEVKESPTLNHIPFILITGSFSTESKLKGIEYGADDYITKPFEKDMLVARVKSLIRKQQSLQKYFYNEITHQKNTLNVSEEYKQFLEDCIAVVERHFDRDDFNIQVFAKEMGMSHSKLYKKIKTISGQSANAFIRFLRLRKAAELFINTDYNISETAFYVGIKDIKYFREQFTKTFGIKPSEYIEKYRKTLGKNYKLNEKVVGDKKD